MKTFFKQIKNQITEKQKMTTFQNVLKKAAYAGSPFLRHFFGHRINRFMMFMLQLISLFTTLAGANYYLNGIHWTAPILFALTIQLGLFYYASSFTDADGRKLPHFFLLTLLTTISIVFSYTGMAIVTFPPENEYEETYQDYCEKADIMKIQLLAADSSVQNIEEEINGFLAKIQASIQNADNKITSLTNEIAVNNDTIKNDVFTSETTKENHETGETTTTTTTQGGNIRPDVIKENMVKTEAKNKIQSAKETLEKAVTTVDFNTLLNYIGGNLTESEKNAATQNIIFLIDCYNTLNQHLETDSKFSTDYINTLRAKHENAKVISNISIEPLEKSSATNQNQENFINIMLSKESSAATALETLNRLKTAVNNNYRQLEAADLMLGTNLSSSSDLRNLKDKINSYGDPNVQVIKYLVDHTYQSKVLGVLVLAVLVDGLTFLLGIIGHKKRLSLLDPSTNKELIDNEEQLFSIIFVSLIGSKMPDSLKNSPGTDFKSTCTTYVNNIKGCIQEFLSHFKNSPWTGQWGYGLYASYQDLAKSQGAVSIISILHQLGYLQFLSKKDFQLLQDKFNGSEASHNCDTATPEDDDYICILRYRVEMYLHHNTAEISTMFIENEFIKEGTI